MDFFINGAIYMSGPGLIEGCVIVSNLRFVGSMKLNNLLQIIQ